MRPKIYVNWGKTELSGEVQKMEATGLKVREEPGGELIIVEHLRLLIEGSSVAEQGYAKFDLSCEINRKTACDLFEKVMMVKTRNNPAMRRVGKALLKEIRD